MKILLSAYGFRPNWGSDAEVGWQWATNLARLGHEVWVITRSANKPFVEAELNKLNENGSANLHFIYFDVDWFVKITNWIRFRHYFYYYFWQWKAYLHARDFHERIHFDIVHHVTWVSVRQPSFMGNLGIPFIFGPVAGGEAAPFALRKGYSFRQWRSDLLRDLANAAVRVDPFMRHTFKTARAIIVTSEDSRNIVPSRFRHKTQIKLAIGIHSIETKIQRDTIDVKSPKLLYVGRFLCWKGMHIGFHALAKLKESIPDIRLTMIGKGADEGHWRKLAAHLKINDVIEWIPWVAQEELKAIYCEHDIFLFPSLHDSGGLVVLEAMRCGLPVVSLKLGGPGVMVDAQSGIAVDTRNKDVLELADDVASAIQHMSQSPHVHSRMSEGALDRVKQFKWDELVRDVYEGL